MKSYVSIKCGCKIFFFGRIEREREKKEKEKRYSKFL